jgi:hypothetical protein
MSEGFESILAEVRRLLEDGKSLAITTIDTPWGDGMPNDLKSIPSFSIFESTGSGHCIQWVILPTGEVKCARYKDDT